MSENLESKLRERAGLSCRVDSATSDRAARGDRLPPESNDSPYASRNWNGLCGCVLCHRDFGRRGVRTRRFKRVCELDCPAHKSPRWPSGTCRGNLYRGRCLSCPPVSYSQCHGAVHRRRCRLEARRRGRAWRIHSGRVHSFGWGCTGHGDVPDRWLGLAHGPTADAHEQQREHSHPCRWRRTCRWLTRLSERQLLRFLSPRNHWQRERTDGRLGQFEQRRSGRRRGRSRRYERVTHLEQWQCRGDDRLERLLRRMVAGVLAGSVNELHHGCRDFDRDVSHAVAVLVAGGRYESRKGSRD